MRAAFQGSFVSVSVSCCSESNMSSGGKVSFTLKTLEPGSCQVSFYQELTSNRGTCWEIICASLVYLLPIIWSRLKGFVIYHENDYITSGYRTDSSMQPWNWTLSLLTLWTMRHSLQIFVENKKKKNSFEGYLWGTKQMQMFGAECRPLSWSNQGLLQIYTCN